MVMKVLIFNSGLGNRMGELTKNTHKSMVRLESGETILKRQLRLLDECGMKEIIITTGPFEEQIKEQCAEFQNLSFTFVKNHLYDQTNYIYSMYLAKEHIKENILMLHGDLVFNKRLLEKMLTSHEVSLCLYHEEKTLPEKDFKGRIINDYLKEVSINIFENDCYAFQPLYKLSKSHMKAWLDRVEVLIKNGDDKVYAENALNEITDQVQIKAMSYKNDYIDEIDTPEDLIRVSKEIQEFE